MANLLGWIGGAAQAVNRDVIQPIDRTVVQPVEHVNQVASNAVRQVPQMIQRAPVVAPLVAADRGILQGANSVIHAPSNLVKFGAADFSHNNQARQNALQPLAQAQHTVGGLAQGIPRGLLQLEQSIRPGGIRQPITTSNPITRFALGKQPINSIQQDYSNARNSGVSRANALTGAGISLAQDVPLGFGAAKLAKGGIKAAAYADIKKPSSLNPTEVAQLSKYHQMMGKGAIIDDATYQNGVRAAQKAGVNPADSHAIGNLIGAHRNYDVQIANRTAQLKALNQKVGVGNLGLSTKDISGKPEVPQTLYHGTSEPRAMQIAKNGLTSGKEAGNTEGQHAYLSNTEEYAKTYADRKSSYPAILRIKNAKGVIADSNTGLKGDYKTASKIAPEDIEIKTPEGWKPIQEHYGVTQPTQGSKLPIPKEPIPTAKLSVTPQKGVRAGTARINKAAGVELKPSTYIKRTQASLQASSDALVKGNLDTATGKVQKALAQTPGRLTDQQLSDAYAVADKHAQLGNTDLSNEIYSKTLVHDTKTAQALAARGMLTKQTPGGMQKMVLNALDKAKVPLEGDLKDKVNGHINEIRGTQAGTPERELAVRKLGNTVAQALPRSKGKAALEFWRAMLISGPQTAAKVAISQPFSGVQAYLSQYPAGAFDALRSGVTGKPRTTAVVPFKGIGSGLKSGLQAAKTKIKTGVDVPGSGGFTKSLEQQLKTGTHQTLPERTIFNLHSAIQKPVHNAIRDNTLARLGKTEAINQGLKGADRKAFIDNYVKSPPDKAYEHAVSAGEEAVNQQKTALGDAANKIQSSGGGAGMVIAPITRVPGAIGTNALYNYSGIKFAKTAIVDGLIKQGKDPEFARNLAESFGKAVVGAGGVSGLGAILGATGNITPAKAESTKQAALFKAEGKPLGSVHIPGTNTWISVNAMGPVGIELATGGGFGGGYSKQGAIGAAEQGLGAGAQTLAQQPYLQGISGVGNVLNNPKQYAKSFVGNLAGSVIPAVSSQIATGTDSSQRQINYNSIKDVLKSRVPGVRESLPAAPDVLGGKNAGANPSGSVFGGVMGTLDALKPSASKGQNDPVTQEIDRLVSTLPSTDSPSISAPLRTQTVNGKKVNLNDQQLADFTGQSGQLIKQGVSSLLNDTSYKSASDTIKANAINDIIKNARAEAKTNVLGDNPTTSSGTPKSVNLTQSAINTVQKASFLQSGKSEMQIGNNVWQLTATGATATPKVQYDYSLNTATMTSQKNAGDVQGYLNTAQSQLQNIQKQLADPTTTPLKALQLQNDASTLQTNIAKYQSYGGFTKGSSSSKKYTVPKLKTSITKVPKIKVAKAKAPKFSGKPKKISVAKIPGSNKKLV